MGIQRGASSPEGGTPADGGPSSDVSTFDGCETDLEMELPQGSGHRRVNSLASSFDESDAGASFSGSSSYAGGSSVPSTPGYTSGPHVHGDGYGLGYIYGNGSASPGVIGLEEINLGGSKSRFSTPRSSILGLPDEDEGVEVGVGMGKVTAGRGKVVDGDVKIVGMDVEVGEAAGRDVGEMGRMDVDS